jgi:thiol-disulfide isomerase/thioredoxin
MKNISDYKNISELSKIEQLLKDKVAVILYFYNDNCAPCKSLRPKIIELVEENFPKIELIFINSIDRNITAKYNVFDMPTLLIYFDNKEYIRKSKYVSTFELQEEIERYYKLLF